MILTYQLLLALFIGIATVSFPVAETRTDSAPQCEEDKSYWKLDREGFLQEMLFAQATPRTPQFDDYTAGSYHVDKLDLLDGMRTLRTEGRTDAIGMIVDGPFGPIWAYSIVTIIPENGQLRANYMLFPHARITLKSTTFISQKDYAEFLKLLGSTEAIQRGIPSFESITQTRVPELPFEWHYHILVVDWSGEKERVYHASIDAEQGSPELDAVFVKLDQMFDEAVVTYSQDLPDDHQYYRIPDEP